MDAINLHDARSIEAKQPVLNLNLQNFSESDLSREFISTGIFKVSDDQIILGAANLYCSIGEFLDQVSNLPNQKIGFRAQTSQKVDIGNILLSARTLATLSEFFLSIAPVQSEIDVHKKNISIKFCKLSEEIVNNLGVDLDIGYHLVTKEQANRFSGYLLESKSAVQILLTQFSMLTRAQLQAEDSVINKN